jgi:hypothetical protein
MCVAKESARIGITPPPDLVPAHVKFQIKEAVKARDLEWTKAVGNALMASVGQTQTPEEASQTLKNCKAVFDAKIKKLEKQLEAHEKDANKAWHLIDAFEDKGNQDRLTDAGILLLGIVRRENLD